MKHELIMSGLLVLGNPMMANAQQTKTTTAENISTDSIQAMKEKLRQDSIQWEKQLAAVTIKGTRSQFRQKNGGIVARISGTSLEKEPTATEVLAKLPGMFKNKDGKIGSGTDAYYMPDNLGNAKNMGFDTQTIIKYNQPAIAAVIKAARDIQRSRLLGNQASKYLESKIIDCLSGFLLPASLLSSAQTFSLSIHDKIHDAQSIILTHYQEMPSLHELAAMVGTNECTLKKAFKQEFGTTVFQYLFDFRMDLAVHYLLDTSLPIADIGIKLGYDYQSHFCTAFKRKHGVSPMEFRLRRGVIL